VKHAAFFEIAPSSRDPNERIDRYRYPREGFNGLRTARVIDLGQPRCYRSVARSRPKSTLDLISRLKFGKTNEIAAQLRSERSDGYRQILSPTGDISPRV